MEHWRCSFISLSDLMTALRPNRLNPRPLSRCRQPINAASGHTPTRRNAGLWLVVLGALSLLPAHEALGVTTNAQGMVVYTAFNGGRYTLKPWMGRNIVLLTPTNAVYQTNIVARIITALDKAYDFYESATSRRPQNYDPTTFLGRDTIAVVNSTCGAGCTEVGYTGTEILNTYFQILYTAVLSANQYDQVLFYEFGRSFWFYSRQLSYQAPDTDPVVTGYAVYMRFLSMHAAGVAGAPFNGKSFSSFESAVTSLMDTYVHTPSLNWSNTFRTSTAPPNSLNLGGTDLIASLLMHIGRDFGGSRFGLDFWKQAELRPTALSTIDAANNFVLAACAATGANLTGVFATTWKWPVSAAAFQEAQGRWGAPVHFQPRISTQVVASNLLRLGWQSQPNSFYQPQESSDLRTWFNVGEPLQGNGSVEYLLNSSLLYSQRFLRLQVQ
jgi:hypothetical protein